ncbi:hypothetical protein Q4488_05860 [Amphritea sp. 1_MG-2023]|uniref:hypothetical protein n=1 Tax=Amphritea sp. 1_MG-2023 TaxID=3062670 RepID=UPI0026E2997B|nr:hypothetical protein [Amphritea sp. 1_MG-2023]MDO6562906.1 hypothetical protein [Amphritea sp. 1_MG-2023]
MKFLAVMLLIMLGRYQRRPAWLIKLSQRWPQQHWQWMLLLSALLMGEWLLLTLLSWQLTVLILVLAVELLMLYLFVENWSPSDLTEPYYRQCGRENFAAAWLNLAGLLGLKRTDDMSDAASVHYAICQQSLYLSLTGFFAPLFWFICLGLPGLCLALWARWQRQRQRDKRLRGVAELMLWIPARLLGLTFFVVGNGVSALSQLKNPASKTVAWREWLLRIALGAMGEESYRQYQRLGDEQQFQHHAAEEMVSLNRLIRRAAIFWLVLLGLLTMLGIETPFY